MADEIEYWPVKDPRDVVILSMDWSRHLGTDTIESIISWTVDPLGELLLGAQSVESNKAKIQVSAGVVKGVYTLRCTILTAGGQTMSRSGIQKVNNR